MVLRGRALRPFERELAALIESQSFDRAVPQLLITFDQAPDRVDDLIIACARRFVTVYGTQTGDISTGPAGEAREVGELLLRAYAQAIDVTAKMRCWTSSMNCSHLGPTASLNWSVPPNTDAVTVRGRQQLRSAHAAMLAPPADTFWTVRDP